MNSQTQTSSDLSTVRERLLGLLAKFERQNSQIFQTDRKLILLIEEHRKQRRSLKRTLDEIIKSQKDSLSALRGSEETLDQEVLKKLESNIAELERLQTVLFDSKKPQSNEDQG